MKAQSLKKISQLSDDSRIPVISEGLMKLASNVIKLHYSMNKLADEQTQRGYRVLRQLCEEEAAKFLILLDYLRYPRADQSGRSRHLGYFYKHFTRSLYAEYCDIRPATWREVCEWIKRQRPSIYLDGPMGVEWIFRNDLLQKREQQMYVDYIEMDESDQWLGPEELEKAKNSDWELPSRIINLVETMAKIGFSESASLVLIESEWASLQLLPETHWKEIESRNRFVVGKILERKPPGNAISDSQAWQVIDGWYFPLINVELSLKKVPESALQNEQESWTPQDLW